MGGDTLSPQPHRHDLVRVDPAAWAVKLRQRPDLDGVPHLAGWAEAGRLLIIRRFFPGEPRDSIPLGLPLPPADGKRRISFAFSPEDLSPHPPLALADTRPAAPGTWHSTLDALIALGAEHGLTPRPFGSLLWQVATGLTYLAAASDLDVLWPLPTQTIPAGLLAALARIAEAAPMRLDGELLLPDGAGLHWREVLEASESGEVLAKHLDRLEMRSVAMLKGRGSP
ncbi:malonate decarboxylase holo-[acyl-carrier-protein] synthase [Methylobacterium gnaphalii]|uniref:Phosphoribosyl-dephospho-CoA transferase n=1 Tax=Methylobacterium gnaphalii TaxID=1010610 RepID=A0A512JML7_9HYPH|nr:malonate decarboxylase holo-[acyl-carrier-protein] synthase [Methylobacterium gnaphalii]GEP11211.1 phosphoribosyl-dephospho-CoA transferase [Methylobacterium gnaphalii]GJD70080.1 Phosphoribosyl-dephospho-CoA transferase [Methylobacterium gnaphalii]GLS49716.1 phosphoribosyl-dephospho-CoA transferase [Methylobacterium gnaphalii]